MKKITKSSFAWILLVLLGLLLHTSIYAQAAKFEQQGADGIVCMEAENYSDLIQPVDTNWEQVDGPENFSGTCAMQATPPGENRHKVLADAQSSAPCMEYPINFVKADTVYVWLRSSHIDGYDDSIWIGMDGQIYGTAPLSYTTAEQVFSNEWHWINHYMGDETNGAKMAVTAGIHVFQIYMREPSFKLDKIVLTTNKDYLPTTAGEQGPPETLPQAAKFEQQGADGLISMEVENYTDLVQPVDTNWEQVFEPENFSGTCAMQTTPPGENRHKVLDDAASNAPYMEYPINFVKAEPVYVWVRASHVDGFDDSVWFGLDDAIEGTAPLQFMVSEQSFSNVWYWIGHLMNDANDRAILQVPSTGVHVFRLYMREPSFKADKIVFTTDPNYLPTDEGPPETLAGGSAVKSLTASVPLSFKLYQNYPNPFNPSTTIAYSLGKSAVVALKIYDLTGKEVDVLVNEFQAAGTYQMTWIAEALPSGIYFYKLQAGDFSETKKLLLEK
jgi:hypothetical protein